MLGAVFCIVCGSGWMRLRLLEDCGRLLEEVGWLLEQVTGLLEGE